MAEILLREMSNSDIDWLVTTGQREPIQTSEFLLRPGENTEIIYLLLKGSLAIVQPPMESISAGGIFRDSARNSRGEQEITQIPRGEIVGEGPLFDIPITTAVKAIEDSVVLSIPREKLTAKMQQEPCFAAHFYRAIALMLSERLRQIFAMPEQIRFGENQSVKDALFVFGELRDSDIDWLISAGTIEKLVPDRVLLQAGRPVDALYIILDGRLSIAIPEETCDPLSSCFAGLEQSSRSYKVFAEISRGGMPGSHSFLDFRPLPVTIRAMTESLVFAIPRPQLVAKLQQDVGLASRFYRVIAAQIAHLLQTVMVHLGCESHVYCPNQGINDAMAYDDELDLEALQQVSQGAARFNWMLQRLGVGV